MWRVAARAAVYVVCAGKVCWQGVLARWAGRVGWEGGRRRTGEGLQI